MKIRPWPGSWLFCYGLIHFFPLFTDLFFLELLRKENACLIGSEIYWIHIKCYLAAWLQRTSVSEIRIIGYYAVNKTCNIISSHDFPPIFFPDVFYKMIAIGYGAGFG